MSVYGRTIVWPVKHSATRAALASRLQAEPDIMLGISDEILPATAAQPPVAVPIRATATGGVAATVDVLARSYDPDTTSLTLTAHSGAANGTASVVSNQARYTPTLTFGGTDTTTTTVSDGTKTSSSKIRWTVTAGANPDPDPPPPTTAFNETAIYGGRFYGSADPGDGQANSSLYPNRPACWRYRVEVTGTIIAIIPTIRWNQGTETNYSSGNGGSVQVQFRKNRAGQEWPPSDQGNAVTGAGAHFGLIATSDSNYLGQTAVRTGLIGNDVPEWPLTTTFNVTAGEFIWICFHQLLDSRISINSCNIRAPRFAGPNGPTTQSNCGPYWGSDLHIARAGQISSGTSWQFDDTAGDLPRHFLRCLVKVRKPDGSIHVGGIGCIFADAAAGQGDLTATKRDFSNTQPVRMQFILKQLPTFQTSRLWARIWRPSYVACTDKTGIANAPLPGNLLIKLHRGTTLIGDWSFAPSRFVSANNNCQSTVTDWHQPTPFVQLDLPAPVTITNGQQHYLTFSSVSGNYAIVGNQRVTTFLSKNAFTDGYAQYSTDSGSTWQLWHGGGTQTAPNRHTSMTLQQAFEVSS
jgi:hypothetical protein